MPFRLLPGRPGSPFLAGSPLLIAHRGGAVLAPENTLHAFREASSRWGADILELDVQPTLDGEAVVLHDQTLERTTDGSGPVADRTLAEIRELDAAYHFSPDGGRTHPLRGGGVGVPTLREVLRALPGVRLNVEIKDPRAQGEVRDTIREEGAERRVLIAAARIANRALLRGSGLPVSGSALQLRASSFVHHLRLDALYRPRVDALQIPVTYRGRPTVTPAFVRGVHAQNVALHVWTVDDPAEMARLLDCGVDGIMTDRPDLLARLLHERTGRPLPPGLAGTGPGGPGPGGDR